MDFAFPLLNFLDEKWNIFKEKWKEWCVIDTYNTNNLEIIFAMLWKMPFVQRIGKMPSVQRIVSLAMSKNGRNHFISLGLKKLEHHMVLK